MPAKRAPLFPANAVVVGGLDRKLFPAPFRLNSGYDEADKPYQRVATYTLVIVPSGTYCPNMREHNRLDYAFVYSGRSKRCYGWAEYFANDYYEPGLAVGGPMCLVECIPPVNHHNPPVAVNIYASTAGVVWLAMCAVQSLAVDTTLFHDMTPLTNLDDAPFGTYFDAIDENEEFAKYTDTFRATFRDRLKLFFGLC